MEATEKNTLTVVEYDADGVKIKLDPETVKNYLVRGNGAVTDQEVLFFIQTCRAQKLNPLAYGEVYLIKFGNEPAQLVIGKETYMKRAFRNPNYSGMKSGIVVQRGETIIQKEGTCEYPSETLIGGWCKVFHTLNEKETETFKEVSLKEYLKYNSKGVPQANWGTKPCTMIEKVAVSQAMRAAFPDDYQGLYTAEEFGYTDRDAEKGRPLDDNATIDNQEVTTEEVTFITQDQRKEFFDLATSFYGKKGNSVVKHICKALGLESTTNMTVQQFETAMESLKVGIEADKKKMAEAAKQSEQNEEKNPGEHE
ncbi:phage recombination protein Bet [uncultured Clostridium sp.]|uniref:phage recombination protein Bet n=1 Tax=uncultured Clostridium sp. TaxID=59620 RepID=UPI0025F86F24|nr:phage recombination protein Bet [uncultured Clostridium sp.]